MPDKNALLCARLCKIVEKVMFLKEIFRKGETLNERVEN